MKSGRLELDAPVGWPDGTEVVVEAMATEPEEPAKLIGIDESQ